MQKNNQIINLSDKIKVIVTETVYEKMQDLCHYIPEVEWSGVLLYSTEGEITNPKSLVITLRDIILMNKGSKTYTGYDFNEKKRDQSGYSDTHIEYCEEFEEALTWKVGMIHSHNTMNVFFSGTDLSELVDNSPSHNYYLSFIVNNKMEMTAKVAVFAKVEDEVKVSYKALQSNGTPYNMSEGTLKVSSSKVFAYDCEILLEKKERKSYSFFEKNLANILSKNDSPNYFSKVSKWGFEDKHNTNPFMASDFANKPSTGKVNHNANSIDNIQKRLESNNLNKNLSALDHFPVAGYNYSDEDLFDHISKVGDNLVENLEPGLDKVFTPEEQEEDDIIFIDEIAIHLFNRFLFKAGYETEDFCDIEEFALALETVPSIHEDTVVSEYALLWADITEEYDLDFEGTTVSLIEEIEELSLVYPALEPISAGIKKLLNAYLEK